MKGYVIVLLSSFIIACNADLNYLTVAEKVVSKLLNCRDGLYGTFDKSFENNYVNYQVTSTRFYDWKSLELKKSSVNGSQLTNNVHDIKFEISLPSPMIKGNVRYWGCSAWFTSEITAISSQNINIWIYARIHETYNEIVWKNVFLTNSLDGKFVSQFDCKLSDMAQCDRLNKWIDGDSGAWNQPIKLVGQIKRLLFPIKYV